MRARDRGFRAAEVCIWGCGKVGRGLWSILGLGMKRVTVVSFSLSWLVWKQILSSKEVRKVRGFRVEFCRLYRDRTAKNKLAVYDINLNQFHSQIISNLLSLISRLNTLSNIFLP